MDFMFSDEKGLHACSLTSASETVMFTSVHALSQFLTSTNHSEALRTIVDVPFGTPVADSVSTDLCSAACSLPFSCLSLSIRILLC